MNRRFDAFLSYSRQASSPAAAALQHAMQRLAKQWTQLRAIKVFRDNSSLPAGPALWTTIDNALDDSGWLVLLASPEAAASKGVQHEAERWLETRGTADQVLIVHCGGTIGWDDLGNTFTANTDSIPPALVDAFAKEPNWIDMAWWDASPHGRADTRFEAVVARLSGAIRDLDPADLIGEDVRQHRIARRLSRAAIGALSVLLVASLVASFAALKSSQEASEQRDTATQRLVASQARVSATTDLEKGLVWADTAYQSASDPASAQALHEVATATPELVRFFHLGDQATAVDATPDGTAVVAGTASGEIVRFEQDSHLSVTLGRFEGSVEFVGISTDGRTVVASARTATPNEIGEATWRRWVDGEPGPLAAGQVSALSPSGRSTAVIPDHEYGDNTFEVHTDDAVWTYGEESNLWPSWVVLPDDQSVAAMNEHGVYLNATHGGAQRREQIPMGTYMFGGSLAADGVHFTYTNGGTSIEVWDLLEPRGDDTETAAQSLGWTESAAVTGISLDGVGRRLVTAADGKLQVSDVGPMESDPGAVRVLLGAGTSPHHLKFVGPDTLVSAAGASVALWDLGRTATMGQSFTVELDACRSCGLFSVAVDDDRTNAVVQQQNSEFHFIELETGRDTVGSIDDWATTSTTSVWLDPGRFLVVNLGDGQAAIHHTSGAAPEPIVLPAAECQSGDYSGSLGTAVRADGQVVVLTDEQRVMIDPEGRTATCAPSNAGTVTSDGNYLVRVSEADTVDGKDTVDVLAVEDLELLGSVQVDGTPLAIADVLDGNLLVVLVHHPENGLVSTVMIDRDSWKVVGGRVLKSQSSERTPLYGAAVNRGRMVTLEGNAVVLYDLATATRIPLMEVGTSVISQPGFGFSADGRTLAISSDSDDELHIYPLDPAEWSTAACRRVWGATGGPELAVLLEESDSLVAGCHE